MYTPRKFIRHRPRLAIAIGIGAATALALPARDYLARGLVAWNVAVWLYLISMGWLMTRASHARVRGIAEEEDRSAVVVLAILSVAAMTSIAAIVLELSAVKQLPPSVRLAHYGLTVATVFGSWLLVGVLFTFHYAHLFYRSPVDARPLRFTDETQNPNYWDFLYFSFTIAVAAQTSDVGVLGTSMRKTVLAQSVLSFLFNAAILGLSINIAAGAVSG